jgi:D-alanyl-D-alanine carboxypeptidase (penicillin-binding protein 5/6)
MNINWKRLISGTLLSFVPLFLFVFFVSGSQMYLLSKSSNQEEIFLGSVSEPIYGADNNSGDNNVLVDSDKDDTDINASSVISIESDLIGNDNIIFEKNKDSKLPIASLTKLMTAIVSFENYDLSQSITISENADSQLFMQTDFKLGDTFQIEKILQVMLIESSNKAAYALSEEMGQENFILLMNQKAKEIGLQNTSFKDPTGISPKNISTVEDLVILAKYILKNYPEIAKISTIKDYEILNFGKITNTNQLLLEFPKIILSKTGFTDDANGCLLVASKNSENDNYFINIILGADDRFLEMRKIINRNNQ